MVPLERRHCARGRLAYRLGSFSVAAMADDPHHDHHHGSVHLGEADWAALADRAVVEGEVLLAFVTDTARRIAERRGPDAPPVRRVLDIGSGPGVGTCELAERFPDAQVVAVDASPAMLERVAERAAARGLGDRVSTHLAELPDGLDGVDPADVIWASLSLHHVGDERRALRALGELLAPAGLLAVAEMAAPMRVLPDDLDVGRPGLADRLEQAEAGWFGAMRAGLPDSVPSGDLAEMLESAGLVVVDDGVVEERLEPPLPDPARRLVMEHVGRAPHQVGEQLDDDDRRALDGAGRSRRPPRGGPPG